MGQLALASITSATTRCDGLHADHRRLVLVSNLVVDVAYAVVDRGFACMNALASDPPNPRLLYQAGHTRYAPGRPHRWRCAAFAPSAGDVRPGVDVLIAALAVLAP